MRPRLVVRIGPEDVGERVSIRRRIPAGPGEPQHSDVVGYLRSWQDGSLIVERRDGSAVTIAEADLVAARTVPPPPTPPR